MPLTSPGQPGVPARFAARFVLQWHITERCNLRCTHCYQDGHVGPELDFDDLRAIVEQFKVLLADRRRALAPVPVRGHVNVTGGEPFIREDFPDLLELFHANRDDFTFAILTNGTLIDGAAAVRLRALGTEFVQVSIEGGRSTNDAIRGEGSLDRICAGLRHLVRERVPTAISFTAQRSNYREFPEVARLGREVGVTRVWADRLIPWGSGGRDEVLSPDETKAFFEIMYAAHGEAAAGFCRTEISMGRALQFLVAGGRPYHCAAGDRLLALQPNGDVLPCRRMPITVGNVLDTPLVDVYHGHDLLRSLRDANRVAAGCEDCAFATKCGGGLRCLAYAMTADPFRADPGCWRAAQAGDGHEGTADLVEDRS